MSETGGDDANAQRASRSVADVHDLRLAELLFDLVEVGGRVKAAETLGVSYGALARAADTGRLSGRMRDTLTRHLLSDASDLDDAHREHLASLERRAAALEEGAGERFVDDDAQVVFDASSRRCDETSQGKVPRGSGYELGGGQRRGRCAVARMTSIAGGGICCRADGMESCHRMTSGNGGVLG